MKTRSGGTWYRQGDSDSKTNVLSHTAVGYCIILPRSAETDTSGYLEWP